MANILWLVAFPVMSFLISAGMCTYLNTISQQRRDRDLYGIRSTRWQIALEIWGIRKVK
jgi:hypothetical protein